MIYSSLGNKHTKRFQFEDMSMKLNTILSHSDGDVFYMSQIDNQGICESPRLFPSTGLMYIDMYDSVRAKNVRHEYPINQYYCQNPDVLKHLNWLFDEYRQGELNYLIQMPEQEINHKSSLSKNFT